MRINFIQESTAVALVKYTCETPGLFLKGLHILDFNNENIPGLGGLDFKWATQVMDPSQINIGHIISAVVVPNLSTRPIQTLDLDYFIVLDCAGKGD